MTRTILRALAPLALAFPLMGNASPGEISKARTILEDSLVDYSGARLRDFRKITTRFGVSLCGQINARNRMGGMTGWRDVAILLESQDAEIAPGVLAFPADDTRAWRIWGSTCADGVVGGRQIDPEDLTVALSPGTPAPASGAHVQPVARQGSAGTI